MNWLKKRKHTVDKDRGNFIRIGKLASYIVHKLKIQKKAIHN